MAQRLTPDIIVAAIAGYEAQRNQIDSRIADLKSMLAGSGHSAEPSASTGTVKRRKKFSAASRRKMAAAQKARWAGIKKAEPPQAKKPKKRKMSAAGKAAIAAAVKRRWAAVRAAKKAA